MSTRARFPDQANLAPYPSAENCDGLAEAIQDMLDRNFTAQRIATNVERLLRVRQLVSEAHDRKPREDVEDGQGGSDPRQVT